MAASEQEFSRLLPFSTDEAYESTTNTSNIKNDSSITTPPPSSSNELFGYVLVACAALAFASNVTCVRIAETHYGMSPYTVVFVLSFVITTLAFLYLLLFTNLRAILHALTKYTLTMVLIRGILGGLTCIALYSAVKYIPSGDADAIYFISPALIMGLSHVFLREHVTFIDVLLSVGSIGGAVLVSVSTSETESNMKNGVHGVLFAVTGAILNASGLVVVRATVGLRNTHFMLPVLALGASSIPISILLGGAIPLSTLKSNWRATITAVACGVFAFVAQTFMHAGLKHSKAGSAAVVRNLEVPLTYLLAIIVLHESPTLVKLFGSLLVVGAAVIIGVRKILRSSV